MRSPHHPLDCPVCLRLPVHAAVSQVHGGPHARPPWSAWSTGLTAAARSRRIHCRRRQAGAHEGAGATDHRCDHHPRPRRQGARPPPPHVRPVTATRCPGHAASATTWRNPVRCSSGGAAHTTAPCLSPASRTGAMCGVADAAARPVTRWNRPPQNGPRDQVCRLLLVQLPAYTGICVQPSVQPSWLARSLILRARAARRVPKHRSRHTRRPRLVVAPSLPLPPTGGAGGLARPQLRALGPWTS
jgi:hypothetical protein